MENTQLNTTFDVIVIGAGIMGSCSAYQAAKNGKKVLLVEQFSLYNNYGSSHGASRIIRLCHTDNIYINMAKKSYELWDEMMTLDGSHEKLYTSCGLLWLGDKNDTYKRGKLLESINAEYEILSGIDIKKRYKHLHYDNDEWYGILDKKGGVIYAEKCLKAAIRLIKKFNGQIKENCKIVEIIPGNIIRLITKDREILECKNLIVTVGGWLNNLLPEIKIKVSPTLVSVNFWKIKKEYEHLFEKYFLPENNSPTTIISRENEHLFMIPGSDFKNMVKIGVHCGEKFDINSPYSDRQIPSWMADEASKHITKHIPFIDSTKPEKIVSCVYQMTDDVNFILDKHPIHKNIVIGSGFSGTGFKFGSVVGEILNQLIDGKEIKCCDMENFSIKRVISPGTKCIL
ncbi:Peroxisomal sarcosine oxidase [Strongyloides ratti]|uniref:Peroxisomal sarcosine oxidase n=1 Tax=Strongyloides ratti TaxID=34506 RepID=A0A090LGK1_STRRB|nr:Peroxisomal sarcosine oxidase [Strongyloides ratti]CEF68907.1 Peroxisomal sarcosine oxidase [Strongyloides ratti]